jgi:hypothetical protein
MRFPQLARLLLFCLIALALPGSAQGLAWSWSNPQPHGNDIVGMARNGTLGVQVCELGRVYTSPDLVNWYSQNSGLTNDLQAVAFFGSRIIITGANGAIAYSDDGVNFTNCSVSTTNWLVSVAASSNIVVAVGDNGVVYTSTSGASWQKQSNPPGVSPSWLTSVAYGNGVFVATGDSGGVTAGSYLANSGDGIHWTNQYPGYTFMSGIGNLEDVTWVNTTGSSTNYPYTGFWAVDDKGHAIYSTNNGVTWDKFSLLNSTNVLYTIAADNVTGLLAGDSEVRLGQVVSNLLTWPEQVNNVQLTAVPDWTYFAALSQSNGGYELSGYDGQLVQSYVTNGNYNWNTPYYSARDWLFQVTLANGLYVAVGDNVRIMTSSDGADWDIEEVPLTNSVNSTNTAFLGVGGSTNLLLAVGSQGGLAVSPNFLVPAVLTNTDGSLFTNYSSSLGVIWYSLSAPAHTTNDLTDVCALGNNFYLVCGSNILSLSFTNWSALNTNNVNALVGGTNWTAVNTTVTNGLLGISVFTNSIVTNGLLVACGDQGKILTSTNGTSWSTNASGVSVGLSRVRCLNGRLLALCESGYVLTSTNGTSWTKVSTGVTNWLNDAVMVSNTCYAVGNQGVVLTSTNFTNWTNIGTITAKSLFGTATQNGQLVVVGFEGTILRSQIVPVTTPVNFTEYEQSDGYNTFSVAGTVDQQFTLDSSTNLVNWVTGPVLNLIYGDGTLIFYQSLPANPSSHQFYRCTLVP